MTETREHEAAAQPHTPYERFVLGEVAELTDAAGVSLEDTFQAAGGDSLKAILLASAIEERYDVVLDVVDIFQADSLGAVAVMVADAVAAQAQDGAEPGGDRP